MSTAFDLTPLHCPMIDLVESALRTGTRSDRAPALWPAKARKAA